MVGAESPFWSVVWGSRVIVIMRALVAGAGLWVGLECRYQRHSRDRGGRGGARRISAAVIFIRLKCAVWFMIPRDVWEATFLLGPRRHCSRVERGFLGVQWCLEGRVCLGRLFFSFHYLVSAFIFSTHFSSFLLLILFQVFLSYLILSLLTYRLQLLP